MYRAQAGSSQKVQPGLAQLSIKLQIHARLGSGLKALRISELTSAHKEMFIPIRKGGREDSLILKIHPGGRYWCPDQHSWFGVCSRVGRFG